MHRPSKAPAPVNGTRGWAGTSPPRTRAAALPGNCYRLNAATGLHPGDRPYQHDQVALLTHPHVNGCVMGVVADGMGGRSGGREASNQVQLTARQVFEHYLPGADDPLATLRQIAHEAHNLIKLTAITTGQEPHSTFAAFLIHPGGECFWAHSGDSRIYHFCGKTLIHRTLDHSYVQTLVAQGSLTEEEAATHPQSNILTGCLGTEEDPPLELHHIPQLHIGDTLLACTDGLWHYFTARELGVVISSMPPREASQLLVCKARKRATGSGDNLSLAIVRLDPLTPGKTIVGSAFAPLL